MTPPLGARIVRCQKASHERSRRPNQRPAGIALQRIDEPVDRHIVDPVEREVLDEQEASRPQHLIARGARLPRADVYGAGNG
jgi:hypothetical protein